MVGSGVGTQNLIAPIDQLQEYLSQNDLVGLQHKYRKSLILRAHHVLHSSTIFLLVELTRVVEGTQK